MGVTVGFDGQVDLEKKLGKGRRRTREHPQGIEYWISKRPTALIETEGFDGTRRKSYLLEYIDWSEEFPDFLQPVKDEAIKFHEQITTKRTSGWLGKIVLGDSSTYVRRITHRLIGSSQTRRGFSHLESGRKDVCRRGYVQALEGFA